MEENDAITIAQLRPDGIKRNNKHDLLVFDKM